LLGGADRGQRTSVLEYNEIRRLGVVRKSIGEGCNNVGPAKAVEMLKNHARGLLLLHQAADEREGGDTLGCEKCNNAPHLAGGGTACLLTLS
jgi:hypothetical protein